MTSPHAARPGSVVPAATWPILAACRMFVALVVVAHHANMYVKEGPFLQWITSLDGDKAVILFFFISGFSIAHSITKEPDGFYKRRFWRIMPVYWACLGLAGAVYLIGFTGAHTTRGMNLDTPTLWQWASLALPLYAFTNCRITGYFQAWSLGLEVVYYAAAPLFLRMRTRYLLTLLIPSALMNLAVWDSHAVLHNLAVTATPWALGFPRLWCWLAGFLFYRHINNLWAQVLPFTAWAVMLVYDKWHTPHGTVMCAAFGVLMICLRFVPALPAKIAKACHVVGDWSYPLYLIHAPALWLIALLTMSYLPSVYLLAVFAGALAVYYAVDLPCRKITKRLNIPFRVEEAKYRGLIRRLRCAV